MKYAIVEESTGRICIVGETHSIEIVKQKAREGFYYLLDPPEGLDTRVTYYDGSDYQDRLTVPHPTESYDLTALPDGTLIRLWNEAQDMLEVTEMTGTLDLVDPGKYRVHVHPPFPYQEILTEVEVA